MIILWHLMVVQWEFIVFQWDFREFIVIQWDINGINWRFNGISAPWLAGKSIIHKGVFPAMKLHFDRGFPLATFDYQRVVNLYQSWNLENSNFVINGWEF